MKIAVHAGHAPAGMLGCGVIGYLNESKENREVCSRLYELLNRTEGIEVGNFSILYGMSASTILRNINRAVSIYDPDLTISIHLNSSQEHTGHGCEVYAYKGDVTSESLARNISAHISESLGIRNRGLKDGSGLSVIREVKAHSILIECCFVDSKEDASKWDSYKCAEAIYEAMVEFYQLQGTDYKKVDEKKKEIEPEKKEDVWYKVQIDAFVELTNAERRKKELEEKGYHPIIVKERRN